MNIWKHWAEIDKFRTRLKLRIVFFLFVFQRLWPVSALRRVPEDSPGPGDPFPNTSSLLLLQVRHMLLQLLRQPHDQVCVHLTSDPVQHSFFRGQTLKPFHKSKPCPEMLQNSSALILSDFLYTAKNTKAFLQLLQRLTESPCLSCGVGVLTWHTSTSSALHLVLLFFSS